MEDLLDTDEVIFAVNTVIIPPRQNKIIKGWTSLVLYGTKINVATEPLERGDPPLPRGLHLWSSHTRYNCRSQKIHVSLYNTKDQPVVIQTSTPVGHMVTANAVPEKVLLPGTLEALDKLESWMPENKEKALDLLSEFMLSSWVHDVFALKHGEMGCDRASYRGNWPLPFQRMAMKHTWGIVTRGKGFICRLYLSHGLSIVRLCKFCHSGYSF